MNHHQEDDDYSTNVLRAAKGEGKGSPQCAAMTTVRLECVTSTKQATNVIEASSHVYQV